ncbi:MAG: lysophospholipid acyltransferase family protein [Patescibacteria group bacterium]
MIPKVIQQFTYWPIYLTLKFFFRYRVEGQENLKGLEDKAVIFVSNHASYLDGPVCAAAMPRDLVVPHKFFPIRFLVVKEYFNYWKNSFPFPISFLVATYVRANGYILVIKGLGDFRQNLAEAVKALEKGAKIWIYPEGKLTLDGKLQPGKKGAAYLHQTTGALIVPVGLNGTFGILKSKKIKIKIGKPIDFISKFSLEEGVEKIMREISKLID